MKSDQFFNGDQYFFPTNNFPRLVLAPTKNFYQLFFLLNTNRITEILEKNYQIYYTIIWLSGFIIPLLKPFIDISLSSLSVVQIDNPPRSDEKEAAIVIKTDQSKPVSHTAAGQSKLVSYTESSSEEEEEPYVEVNFDEPIDLAIN